MPPTSTPSSTDHDVTVDPDVDATPNPVAALTRATVEMIDGYMAELLRQRPLPGSLREAIEYSLLGPGKRLRPVLCVQACLAVGGSEKAARPAAAAIEMIHAFSLIHDDLPAMDDDDLRRGRPTLHKHTSEAMAILAGDALNTLAFETLATHAPSAAVTAALTRELAVATNDMIAGQVYDTLPHDEDNLDADGEPLSDFARLERIHQHKTGALLRCACRMGAICGQASAEQLDAVTDYAEAVGLMFQIVDDLLDVTSDAVTLGKATQKDLDAGKLTYPGLLGVDGSRAEIESLRERATAALDRLDGAVNNPDTPPTGSGLNAQNDAGTRRPDGPRSQALRDLCDYLATRDR